MSELPFQAPSPEYLAGLLPQYDIERFIAQGGMGAVYKGRQISLDRDVAIKILPREMGEDPEFRESFESEAKAMARLNHPNLLGVFDFGSAEGMPYIAMEYVHGKSLHDSAWNQAIDPAQTVAIVKGICAGLAHAHENGIVHRDIKPSNILLTQTAVPKIGDFGLAHAADSDKPGLVMGTPGYTAPEVFQDPNQAGPLADIYSVGVILHQLLTGIDPAGCLEPPSQVTGNPRLDAIWRKATQITPALRYQSVVALAADLENSTATKSAVAASPRRGPPVQHRRPVQVKKSGDGGVLKLVMICILAGASFFAYRHMEDGKRMAVDATPKANETMLGALPQPMPDPAPKEHLDSHPAPVHQPEETVMREEPVSAPIVEPRPDEKPERDLPPGDPDLQARAVGLIADSRQKRDKELAENIRSLRNALALRSHSTQTDDAKIMDRLEKAIEDNRIPVINSVEGFSDKLATSVKQVGSKQDVIDTAYRSDLTRIRDAYVTRLKGAATDASDEDLKRRLQAQAERAADLNTWIRALAPEPERVSKRFSAVGFEGKWEVHEYNNVGHWIAYSDGRLESVGQKWKINWVILENGSLEVNFEGKPRPYRYTRDGDGWTGKTTFGKPSSLTPEK